MPQLLPRVRTAALGFKVVGFAVGLALVSLGVGIAFDEFTYLSSTPLVGVGDVVVLLATGSMIFAGGALVAQLPESLTARFKRIPGLARRRPVYGFGTMVAVGVGATLGSPLFILIPLNVEQYEVVSIASLGLATLLSLGMAKVYSDMYKESRAQGQEGVGGPSFAKLAWGRRSVRYFVSRVSMWVANTALAAYTKIVFLVFDFAFLPRILSAYGLGGETTNIVVYGLAAAFVLWTLVNVLFERRYLKALGNIQVVLTGGLVVMLALHSLSLGGAGGWDLTGLFQPIAGGGWPWALIVNTGYLYLLFFGFQEIQALERDALERSKIPIISNLRKGFTMERTRYLGVAMVASVLIAASLNILYGLAVFSAHPDQGGLVGSQIPAIYLAQTFLGTGQELLVAAAFLIAAVTTFVPAFLAAARHLSALGEDGYMPESLASASWLFTLVAIFLLAIGSQNFLVNITDFMVLLSLGVVTLSAVALKGRPQGRRIGKSKLALVISGSCFLFGGAVYFIDPTVVVFGSVAVIFAYLVFDIIELGNLGLQLFASVFGLVCAAALTSFKHTVLLKGIVQAATFGVVSESDALIVGGLLLGAVLLTGNLVLDVKVLRRTVRG